MHTLERSGTIDIHNPLCKTDPRLSINYVKGEARGQMFGVLECCDRGGNRITLKAFSGQYNGVWDVKGWAPPLFDTEKFNLLVKGVDKEIKHLGRMIKMFYQGSEREKLINKRKRLSQDLMKEIHSLYHVHNFKSEVMPLTALYKNGIPAGAGDCCGPKLLNAAAKMNLVPISLAELFWGKANLARTRMQGDFYGPCKEKCMPLMGFMLCGANPKGYNDYLAGNTLQ